MAFDGFLLIHNNITEETSWIYLPFGEAKLLPDGYIEDPLSMTVYNSFALRGIADSLPDNLRLDY